MPPMRNVPASPHMGFSSNYSIPPPLISIYVDDFFLFVRFQAPPFFPSQVLFPRHSSPPFIQVQTHPFFDRQFIVWTHIHDIARHSQPSPSNSTLPSYPFYLFSICITLRNAANHPLHDDLGTYNIPSTHDDFHQPPTTAAQLTTSP